MGEQLLPARPDPGSANQYAIYNCYNGCSAGSVGAGTIAPVGSTTLGAGLWGQLDLAGELREWTMDLSAQYVNPCTDCASLTGGLGANGEVRAGGYLDNTPSILPTARYGSYPQSLPKETVGFRCARAP